MKRKQSDLGTPSASAGHSPGSRIAPEDGKPEPAKLSPMDVLVPLATAGTLAMNGLANSIPIGGETTGAISAAYPTLITPAGYAFSIWGVIYLGLVAFSVEAVLPRLRGYGRWPAIRALYLLSGLLNSLWIVLWHHRLLVASALVIAMLLASLLAIYRLLDGLRAPEGSATRKHVLARWLVLAPFSLYASWVTLATLIQMAVTLTSLGFDGGPLSPVAWAVILLTVAAVLGFVVAVPRRDALWLAVGAWALMAIAVARGGEPTVRVASASLGVAMAMGALGVTVRPRRRSPRDRQ